MVDDDGDIRQLCADTLIGSGYHVDTAENGVAGWEALRANSYDLLITDYNMPALSGVELVKKLRSARMNLPVVLVSGTVPAEEISRDPSLQLAATLLKPFTIVELLEKVASILGAEANTRKRLRTSLRVRAADACQLTLESQAETGQRAPLFPAVP